MAKNPELIVKHWIDQSLEDLKSAHSLLKAGRYTWCAFICQQSLEKILKASYVAKNNTIPPYIHKLERLCYLLNLALPQELLDSIIEIDKYYIAARYPSYVESLNIKNSNQAKELFQKTKRIYKWISEELKLTEK